MDPEMVPFFGTVFEVYIYIYIYTNQKVSKSIDFGSILDQTNSRVWDPLIPKSLDTCPHGKHISQTFLSNEREGRREKWSLQTTWGD